MKQADYIRIKAQVAILKEIAIDYSGKTINNIIQQMESIIKEVGNEDKNGKEDNESKTTCLWWLRH